MHAPHAHSSRRDGRLTLVVIALCAAFAGVLIGSGTAATAATAVRAADDVKWSVAPADADGPDGRRWVQTSLPPGGGVDEHMAVRNLSDQPLTFALTAADGYLTDTGRFAMLTPDKTSVDAGLWIRVPETVTVAPGATEVVDIDVEVPDDAQPGEHLGAVAASIRSVGTDSSGAQVGIDSRMGFRVVIDVTGEAEPALAVTTLSSEYEMSWNPFAPGRLVVGMTAKNTGSVDLAVSAGAQAQGIVETRDDDEPLAPGAGRVYRVTLDEVWPWGAVGVTANVVGEASEFRSADRAHAERTETVWAMPWPQILCLVAVVAVIGAIVAVLRARSRARQRWEERVAAARAEGARDALADRGDASASDDAQARSRG